MKRGPTLLFIKSWQIQTTVNKHYYFQNSKNVNAKWIKDMEPLQIPYIADGMWSDYFRKPFGSFLYRWLCSYLLIKQFQVYVMLKRYMFVHQKVCTKGILSTFIHNGQNWKQSNTHRMSFKTICSSDERLIQQRG